MSIHLVALVVFALLASIGFALALIFRRERKPKDDIPPIESRDVCDYCGRRDLIPMWCRWRICGTCFQEQNEARMARLAEKRKRWLNNNMGTAR